MPILNGGCTGSLSSRDVPLAGTSAEPPHWRRYAPLPPFIDG